MPPRTAIDVPLALAIVGLGTLITDRKERNDDRPHDRNT
jgi:hypothetical protein